MILELDCHRGGQRAPPACAQGEDSTFQGAVKCSNEGLGLSLAPALFQKDAHQGAERQGGEAADDERERRCALPPGDRGAVAGRRLDRQAECDDLDRDTRDAAAASN